MVDLFDELGRNSTFQRIRDLLEESARERDGVARTAEWFCEDGWVVSYTTTRVEGGPHDGKFVTQTFKPVGKGARSGNASTLVQHYRREFSTRKAARKRAIDLYRQHSPEWSAKHPNAS